MDKHLNLLGILYIVLGVFHIVSLSIAAIFLFAFDAFRGLAYLDLVRAVIAVVFGVIVLISILSIIAGIGLLKGQSWARGLALVLGFILLLNIPLGTMLGIYTIWVLLLQDRPPQQAKAV